MRAPPPASRAALAGPRWQGPAARLCTWTSSPARRNACISSSSARASTSRPSSRPSLAARPPFCTPPGPHPPGLAPPIAAQPLSIVWVRRRPPFHAASACLCWRQPFWPVCMLWVPPPRRPVAGTCVARRFATLVTFCHPALHPSRQQPKALQSLHLAGSKMRRTELPQAARPAPCADGCSALGPITLRPEYCPPHTPALPPLGEGLQLTTLEPLACSAPWRRPCLSTYMRPLARPHWGTSPNGQRGNTRPLAARVNCTALTGNAAQGGGAHGQGARRRRRVDSRAQLSSPTPPRAPAPPPPLPLLKPGALANSCGSGLA